MTVLETVVVLVAAQRLVELLLSRRNERILMARGGEEVGADHYPYFFLVHGAWLLALLLLVPAERPVNWAWLSLFLLLQLARVWVIASLGPYWTTRIINVPDAPLIRSGPYRWSRHPNYIIVAAEIAVLPIAFSAYALAAVFTMLNAALLWHRIRIENEALAPRRNL